MPSPDQTALVQKLFVQHLVPLRGFLLGLSGDFHRVDDLVQETFLTALEKADDYQDGTNFRAWIFSIGRFKLLSSIRDAGRDPLLFEPDVVEQLAESAPDFSANERRTRHLQVCIDRLAPKARQAMELYYQHGHPPREVAPLMGWSVNAVKVALSRARAVVRRCIEHRMTMEGGET
jgi:RNA polymerase sigma-70 factor, ECF subfamily